MMVMLYYGPVKALPLILNQFDYIVKAKRSN